MSKRIVILDNDQTTGDYDVFFKWLYWLESAHARHFVNLRILLPNFVKIFERSLIYRPGLKSFLQRLAQLKQEGKIDHVVIYTNQTESNDTLRDINGLPIVIPQLLEMMYNMLAGYRLIDLRLCRPSGESVPTKTFSRVFDQLQIPKEHWTSTKVLFFDDLLVDQNGLKGHVHVSDYRVLFDPSIFLRLCTITCLSSSYQKSYKKDMQRHDINVARGITEVLETQLLRDVTEPYFRSLEVYGNPRHYGFSKYMDFVEKTFNDMPSIEV
jgi:hypothetical protein